MIFFAEKVRRVAPGNFTFLFMTDRDDLDDQIYKPFVGCGIYEALPSPPYSHEDTGIVAEHVYDYVWQRSASGHLFEGSLAA